MVVNFIWAVLCIFAFFIRTPMEFYVAATGVGMVMGGIQALSRSTYSKLIPETKDTTSFSVFMTLQRRWGSLSGWPCLEPLIRSLEVCVTRYYSLSFFLFPVLYFYLVFPTIVQENKSKLRYWHNN